MKFNSSQLIPLSFFAAIIIGTILLDLPIATASGTSAGLVTSLFTSTTSICVTGLVVVDSYAYWSLFGKIVILILIQLGGLGVISVLSNIAPRQTHEICQKCLEGDYAAARELQFKAYPLVKALFSEVNPIPVKSALKMIGFNAGPLRLPLTEMEPQNQEKLREEMIKFGLEVK